jgi:hypothetical protein
MKACHENIGVRPIILFGFYAVGYGSDLESASLGVIQNGGEDTRGIEVGKTHPIDRAIHADQGGRAHVPDQAVIFYWLISHPLKPG